ncbi:MAG: c-type cytochrome biogenesis protein CcmI [Rhodospirillales bacterium]
MFWVFAGVMALVVAGVLVLPQLRARKTVARRAEYDINVYKDQLVELDRDQAEGRIADTEAAAARIEIQRRLLAAAEDQEAGKTPKGSPRTGLAVIVVAALAVPAASVVFYLQTGTPAMPDFPLAERTDVKRAPEAAGFEGKTMREMAGRLEERLRDNPDDARGWTLLGRTYANIGEPRPAAAAYQRAVELTGRDPELLADWAEARLMVRDGSFTPEIFADFLEARDKNPLLPKPWFYIGLDKAMGGDLEGAAQTWTDLLAIQPEDAPFVAPVREQIARAAEEGGFDVSQIEPSETAKRLAEGTATSMPQEAPAVGAGTASPVAPGPTREQVEAAQDMTAEERAAFIRSMVTRLAEKLEENPNDPAGWERLIRAYEVLGETDKAAEARKRLDALREN